MASSSSQVADEDFSPPPLRRESSLPIYPVLHEHNRQIRLIELLPSIAEEDVVQCKFQTISLGEESSYESLSYVWGDSNFTKQIIVDNIAVDVTANLENALRHIRELTDSRLIWVDALCINQTDHPEKTRQIKMMGDIYKNSKQGLLWLGDFRVLGMKIHEAKAIKEFIHVLADDQYMATLRPGEFLCLGSKCHGFYFNAFMGLKHLLSSSWWTRIWTVQEVVLPPSSSLVFGHESISWQAFENAATAIIDHGWSCCKHMTEPKDMASILNQWTPLCFSIATIRQREQTALAALWRFRDRAATDPRDKVLGVLGLIPDLSLGADSRDFYDIGVAELYHRLTIALINHHGNLCPLLGRRGEPSNVPELASWAIDWTIPPKSSEKWPWELHSRFWVQYCRFEDFHACGTLKLAMKDIDDISTILLDGIFVDRIESVGEPAVPDGDHRLTLQNWRRLCPTEGSYITGGSWDKVFYRTMIGDLIAEETEDWPTRPPKLEDRRHFNNYWSKKEDEEEYLEYGFIEKSIENNIGIQRFFVTTRGYIGVGSPVLDIGDEVWVIGGGNLPIILRGQPKRGNWDTEKKCFTLLGDSYVHGIMNGEAVVGTKRNIETIALR